MPLRPWMRYLLRFAGTYNLLAGLVMVAFYHELFKSLAIAKPDMNLFVQLSGVLVALFGVGYHLVAANPVENRQVLLLGLASKTLGSVLGIAYVALGKLPPFFLGLLFVSDIVYLPPFWIIYRRLERIAAGDL